MLLMEDLRGEINIFQDPSRSFLFILYFFQHDYLLNFQKLIIILSNINLHQFISSNTSSAGRKCKFLYCFSVTML